MKNFVEINRTPLGVKKNDFKSIVQTKARWLLTFCALLTLGIGQVWAWGSYTFSGDYLYFKANNIRNESGTSMEWMKDGAYARCYGALSSNESGGTTYNYYRNEVDETNHIYRTVLPSGTWNLVQLVRCSSTGSNWTWSYKMDASNFANGKNYLWDDGTNYNWSYFAEDAYVVFDNSDANWDTESVSKYIYFNIGRSGYTSGGNDYKMTNVTNTKLYYKRIQKWANYDRYRFCYTSNYDQHNTDMQVTPSVDGYTAIVQNSTDVVLKVNTLNLYTFSGSNGTAVTKTECDEYADLNNITIYIKEKYNSSGAGTFVEVSSGTAHGTISASGYVFDSWTTCTGTATGASITKETETYSSSSVFGYTSTVTLTAGATKAGKAFVGWYRSDGTLISTDLETTITAKTNNEVVYAYYKDEVTNDITVSYKCGDDVIKTSTTELAVGVTTTRSVTAPNIDHYEFVNWTYGDGVTVDDDDATTININSVGNGSNTYTLTANYKHLTRFYFANTSSWSNVYAYMWQESSKDGSGTPSKKNANWPGEAISSQEVDPCGLTLYYYDYDASTGDAADWDHIIFNNGLSGSGNQTSDLTTSGNTDKMYVLSKTTWYDINNHTVSVVSAANHMGTVSGGGTAKAYGCSAAISAEEKPGYRFNGWSVTSGTAVIADASSKSTTVTASSDATITASFTQDGFIYFDNTMTNWEGDIYIYVFDNNSGWYDNAKDGKGPGMVTAHAVDPTTERKMTHIEGTKIYYYDCASDGGLGASRAHNQWIGFTKGKYINYNDIKNASAVYVSNHIGGANSLNCYMASASYREYNKTGYHWFGYWKNWGSTNSGFTLYYTPPGNPEQHIAFTTEDPMSSIYSATVSLSSSNSNYSYNVARSSGANKLRRADYSGSIQDSDSDYPRELSDAANANGSLRTSAAGTYNFTLSLATDHIMMTVEYPLSVGDYRVRLNDGAGRNHPSGRVIRARSEELTDTVSFFIDHTKTNTLYVDTCTSTGNPPAWNRISDVDAATITLTGTPYTTKTGIYKFGITRSKNKNVSLVLLDEPEYDGKYYIRTDVADGNWTSYMSASDNIMQYSDYSLTTSPAYDYYYTKWAAAGKNMHFVIANDYSPCITDTLTADATYLNASDALPANANVRFAWNSGTNATSRAFISGSSDINDRFLVLEGDSKMFDEDGNALTGENKYHRVNENETVTFLETENHVVFEDDHNWIYETTVKAKPGAKIKLTAKYNNEIQYFYGKDGETSADSVLLLGGAESDDQYKMRIVYDFKTNRLIKAFIPEGTINSDLEIEADLMIIREHQENAQQISFSGEGKLSNVKTAYGALKINKWTVNNKSKTGEHNDLTGGSSLSQYQRDLFWISFPFEVNAKDVFGFGTYGQHWIIEYYDGKGRAEHGFWADSEPNWKFVTPAMKETFTLNANEGYIVALDLDELTTSSEVWDNGTEDVYIYFPSSDDIGDISATEKTVGIDQTGYECKINRGTTDGDRRIKDSYWHCIGAPSFANISHASGTSWVDDDDDYPNVGTVEAWRSSDVLYVYQWNSSDNTLTPVSTSSHSFLALYSYLVQYSKSTISWTSTPAPSSVAARVQEMPDREYNFVLLRDSMEQDHTYVRLTDDAAVTNSFEFNYDLCKEYNGGKANIWTVTADTVEVAGNSMPKPVQTTVVPVGVKVVANGEYTFSMPEGTNGEDVYLIDNAYGTRTNLGLMPYTVTLTAGTYDSRFALEFAPIQDAPTGIEQMSTVNYQLSTEEVRKVFVGGRLYIIRDGKVFDATGHRVE